MADADLISVTGGVGDIERDNAAVEESASRTVDTDLLTISSRLTNDTRSTVVDVSVETELDIIDVVGSGVTRADANLKSKGGTSMSIGFERTLELAKKFGTPSPGDESTIDFASGLDELINTEVDSVPAGSEFDFVASIVTSCGFFVNEKGK